jgi:predicted nucleotide-binding protein
MALPDFRGLRDFLAAARGRSQEEIITRFLEILIKDDEVADAGSVLVNHPRQKKLILFDEKKFLITTQAVDSSKWQREFEYAQGVAGKAFDRNKIIHWSRDEERPTREQVEFFGNSPIQNMICLPIKTGQGPPFGVVCLHNNDPNRKFAEQQIANIEAFVDIFALALHMPHPELELEKSVFIVHGHDKESLGALKDLLRQNGVQAKVLQDEDKNATNILTALEGLIRECTAGLILATPDDRGRAVKGGKLEPRVRENVMFEAGLLFAKFRQADRVAMLLKEPLELPSDLQGIFYLPFQTIWGVKDQLVTKLEKWGLVQANARAPDQAE